MKAHLIREGHLKGVLIHKLSCLAPELLLCSFAECRGEHGLAPMLADGRVGAMHKSGIGCCIGSACTLSCASVLRSLERKGREDVLQMVKKQV
jgi:hypothetical protein